MACRRAGRPGAAGEPGADANEAIDPDAGGDDSAPQWTDMQRQLVALTAGRSLQGASIMLSMFASSELLFDVFRGDQGKTQRVLSLVSTGTSLVTFVAGPHAAAVMDSVGRRPFLVLGAAVSAATRLAVSLRPSVKNYVAYRFAIALAMMGFFPAFRAAVADLVDRTSDQYTETMALIDTVGLPLAAALGHCLIGIMNTASKQRVATVVRMSALAASGFLTPRQSMIAGSAASFAAAACFAVGTTETLREENRRPIDWTRLRNPLSSLKTLTQTPGLARLAALSVLIDIPDYNSTLQMYRKQRFGWGMLENSRMALVGQLVSLSSSSVVMASLKRLGTRGTAVLSQRLAACAALVNAFAAQPALLLLSPALQSLRHGATAFDRVLSAEAKLCGLGEGEKEMALASLSMVVGTVAPNVFSEVFACTSATRPNTVFALCAALHLANAELAIPALWPGASGQGDEASTSRM